MKWICGVVVHNPFYFHDENATFLMGFDLITAAGLTIDPTNKCAWSTFAATYWTDILPSSTSTTDKFRQSENNLLSSNISSTCPHNMANFGPLAAEIVSLVWGTTCNFNGFCVLAVLLHGTLVVGVSQTAALNRGRHLYSAGRQSGWAMSLLYARRKQFCVCRLYLR